MADNARAVAVLAASRAGAMGGWQERDGRVLIITRGPRPLANAAGDVVGVQCWVESWDADLLLSSSPDDRQDPIDGHRQFVNPPTGVVEVPAVLDPDTGDVVTPAVVREDPTAAMWECLWQTVTTTPGDAL